jgi:hypothetical protein
MDKIARPRVLVVACLLLVPSLAAGQASITGTVRDSSGGVLPGVTVEASSPALIEKVRAVTTDGTGQYRIVDLRPGTYAVTFQLPGFSTVKREGIELAGTFTASVNVELRVGAVEETVTVTGESPVVDVQSVTQQRVLDSEAMAALPTGRSIVNLSTLIPGIQANTFASGNGSPMDVGGTASLSNTYLSLHGSSYLDQRLSVDGTQVRNILGTGNANNYTPDIAATQEVTIDIAAGSVEQFTGGVRINLIPKEGGNNFRGSFFATGANSSFQAENITPELRARGLLDPNALVSLYDVNGGVGGPIAQDRVWFFASTRFQQNKNYVGGMYENANAYDPTKWLYVPDFSRQATYATTDKSVNARITVQATTKDKLNLYWQEAKRFWQNARPNTSPEAFSETTFPVKHLGIVSWTSAQTSRLLFEARASTFADVFENRADQELTPAVEQGGIFPGLIYRDQGNSRTEQPNLWAYSGAMTYVTGAHSLKVGAGQTGGTIWGGSPPRVPITEVRLRDGIPNRLTQTASPSRRQSSLVEFGAFVQDRWTYGRLSLNGGVRFDYLRTFFREQSVGPMPLAPTLNITFPYTPWYDWKDISPRVGASYDLFGTGKTAIKGSISRYLAGHAAGEGNPVGQLALSTTRTWTDVNRDFVANCDLLNLEANGECGVVANRTFGRPIPTEFSAPAILRGWGKRLSNVEMSASIEHEVARGVGLNVGYFRRVYNNFQVVDNRATEPSDYTMFSITAPLDPRLPGGGGYQVTGLLDVNPNKVGQVANVTSSASDFGNRIHTWQGIDVNASLRRGNTMLQAGLSTGRTLTDNCEIVGAIPEVIFTGYEELSLDRRAPNTGLTMNPFCRVSTPYLTQYKGFGTYIVPKVDVLIAATLQSFPGQEILANYVASNAQVFPSLGRPLSGGAANVTVPLIAPGTMYGPRSTMVDLRLGKPFRIGTLRATPSLDIYNVFNSSNVTVLSWQYEVWQRPQTIIAGRLFKFSAQVDF